MKLLRAATLSVPDVSATAARYERWLDMRIEERGALSAALAASWAAPSSAGRPFAVLRPASGADIFVRLVQNDVHAQYEPLRSYGWAAIEICVRDVLATAARMGDSPFEIIGPPREIEGLDAIYPMQVRGPDQEIVYLTQIRDDLPEFDLPRAQAAIDHLFIMVMACSDLPASLDWMARNTGLAIGREALEIKYTMLAEAFGLPVEQLHTIATMVHERDVFLELDQYPPQAIVRPHIAGALPQGVALGTLACPDFDALDAAREAPWITRPDIYDSCVYDGGRAGTLRAPDGTLVEIVEVPPTR